MSFMLTTPQIIARTKTVTRRLGWGFLKPGDRFRAVEKAMGIKKGEHMVGLAVLEVVLANRVRLGDIDDTDLIREGFPEMSRAEFVAMFCRHMKCKPNELVNRIEFRYVEKEESNAGR